MSFKPIKILCFSYFLSLIILSPAHANSKHALDLQMESCIEKDSTTVGMMQCTRKFRLRWDEELNRYYKLLGGNQNASLRRAQVAWIKYRDLEFKRIEALYQKLGKQGGTIWGLMAGGDKLELIKSRALNLKHDYQLLTCGMECTD